MKMEYMRNKLREIEDLIKNFKNIKTYDIQNRLNSFFSRIQTKIDNYIGDYPTFIEPVYLEENVKIGDDVLLGPNVFIGANSEIGNYVEISNSIIFGNVKIGENFKLENCIITKNSALNFSNLTLKNYLIRGISNSEEEIIKIKF